jgi:hypothetical protein
MYAVVGATALLALLAVEARFTHAVAALAIAMVAAVACTLFAAAILTEP